MSARVLFEKIPTEQLTPDPREVAARMGAGHDFTNDTVEHCAAMLRAVLDCRYCAVRVKVKYPAEDVSDLGFGELKSHALYRNLAGCEEAFVFAVTTGIGVDRLLTRLSHFSAAEHFMTDALSSAYAEAACDYADAALRGALKCRPRFSPGYGDLPLDVQPGLLAFTNASRLLGITLGKTLLMSPVKSITAIMGILSE